MTPIDSAIMVATAVIRRIRSWIRQRLDQPMKLMPPPNRWSNGAASYSMKIRSQGTRTFSKKSIASCSS